MQPNYNTPIFSIITPTNNRLEFLRRNIRSVINQSFGNYEHIIIDDSGCDSSANIVLEFCDNRIIYVKHDRCRGAAAAYNTGIKKSKGQYITFLDDDDEYFPDFLQEVCNFFTEDNNETGFIWTGICRTKDSGKGNITTNTLSWPEQFLNEESGLIAATSIGNGFGVCIKKECIDTIGLFDENLRMSSDTEYLFRLAENFSFKVLSKTLVKIHKHNRSQLTDSENDIERIRCYEIIMERNRNILDKYPSLLSEHFNSLAGLCYRSGNKKKGRTLIFSIIKRNPFRWKIYPDLFSYEITGRNFTATAFGRTLKKLVG